MSVDKETVYVPENICTVCGEEIIFTSGIDGVLFSECVNSHMTQVSWELYKRKKIWVNK